MSIRKYTAGRTAASVPKINYRILPCRCGARPDVESLEGTAYIVHLRASKTEVHAFWVAARSLKSAAGRWNKLMGEDER